MPRIFADLSDVKPCPFCGAELRPGEVNFSALSDEPMLRSLIHPHRTCYLCDWTINLDRLDLWNKRKEDDG